MAQESEVLAVTSTSATATFTSAVYYVEIYNAGSKTCYVNFGADATANHFPVYAGETLKLFANISDVRAITSGADTTTLQIVGTR